MTLQFTWLNMKQTSNRRTWGLFQLKISKSSPIRIIDVSSIWHIPISCRSPYNPVDPYKFPQKDNTSICHFRISSYKKTQQKRIQPATGMKTRADGTDASVSSTMVSYHRLSKVPRNICLTFPDIPWERRGQKKLFECRGNHAMKILKKYNIEYQKNRHAQINVSCMYMCIINQIYIYVYIYIYIYLIFT